MHVRHAHACVKLIAQAKLCIGKIASIYIGMHACMHACMHVGLGNVGMHVWHVHERVIPAGTLPVQCVCRSGRNCTLPEIRSVFCAILSRTYELVPCDLWTSICVAEGIEGSDITHRRNQKPVLNKGRKATFAFYVRSLPVSSMACTVMFYSLVCVMSGPAGCSKAFTSRIVCRINAQFQSLEHRTGSRFTN